MADECCGICCLCAMCFACFGDKSPFCCSDRAAKDAAIDAEYAARFGNEELVPDDDAAPGGNQAYGQRQPMASDMQMPNPGTESAEQPPMTYPPSGANGHPVNGGAAQPGVDPYPKNER
ncbi:hypothetical protein D9619_002064 [Psilocybe cf. subviscida]|uniref:Uncharacterized protein n=1 Tax=Psilocybe cf. subviscida TaxID=2480587 RepID=A0A8H5BCV7_9AGAR|nr:hypothetical protein D9619_002064 [Psilocybe cf. subviscida]